VQAAMAAEPGRGRAGRAQRPVSSSRTPSAISSACQRARFMVGEQQQPTDRRCAWRGGSRAAAGARAAESPPVRPASGRARVPARCGGRAKVCPHQVHTAVAA